MKLIYKISLVLTLVMLALPAHSQLLTAEAKIDTSAILIGDQVNFQLEIVKPKEVKINFPEFEGSIAEGIEIVEKHAKDTFNLEEDKQRIIQRYTVTSFDSGLLYIPPVPIPFTYGEIKDTIETKAGYLEVFTVPVDMQADIKDIKEPYIAPITFIEILPYLLGGIVTALLIIFLIKYFSNRKKEGPDKAARKPKEPAHVIAFRELDSLKQKKLWQAGKIKEYYTELTEIIRRYIERRFEIKAMEETSEEIFEEFRKRKLDKELYFELLRQLLIKADLVKFAKDHPLPDENESYYNHAHSFVEHSINMDETKEEAEEETKDKKELVTPEEKEKQNG